MPATSANPDLAKHPPGLPHQRYHLPAWARSSFWPGLVLIVVACGLLWGLHHVANGIVQQSELRAQATSLQNKATWRCNTIGNQIARKNCLALRKTQLIRGDNLPQL